MKDYDAVRSRPTKLQSSPLGRKLQPILEARDAVFEMMIMAKHGEPSLKAVDAEINQQLGNEVDDPAKRNIGAWICDLMAREGLESYRTRRLPRGSFFSTGAVYRRRQA